MAVTVVEASGELRVYALDLELGAHRLTEFGDWFAIVLLELEKKRVAVVRGLFTVVARRKGVLVGVWGFSIGAPQETRMVLWWRFRFSFGGWWLLVPATNQPEKTKSLKAQKNKLKLFYMFPIKKIR